MSRDPTPTWYFSIALVRRGDRFLLVQEAKHGQQWYLPAGRAEPGETLADAAIRETREEAGIDIRLTGIVAIEHTPRKESARVRAVFLAEPTGDQRPKSVADEHSLRAEWVHPDELGRYDLRGLDVIRLVRRAGTLGAAPLSILGYEGA